ncbi:MobC family plasmid mobilization relaxosome protein [Stenotrophomonas mori]|uniref:MobC family plasmid mobilization relaxosome protein n=1 Tax=Stenotrophomonas mori TaxID=2871096 RepID=A0ABT0SFH6_9GAMM|nr:MobC family plasmid mobilization relaxosome protein [Stenotrophomonas mori]MCL7714076.1 MobC family plasmid mobilization relaxosome protein [Stenotrophomonas mori]
MNDKSVVSLRLPSDLKHQWALHCRSKGQSPSEALRSVIRHLLKSLDDGHEFDVVRQEPDETRVRVEIRMTASEREAVDRIAARAGTSVNKWMTDLVRAYITHKPQLGMHELQVVGESNNQLRAIGRNLNQIALVLNRGDQAGDLSATVAKLVNEINQHTERVHFVIRSNLERWRITWR